MRMTLRCAAALEGFDQDETAATAWARLRRWRCFRLGRRRCWRRSVKQTSREGDVVGACGIGEEAVMANAVKAVRQNVKQEAADEVVAVKRYEAVAVLAFTPIVLPLEGDAARLEGHEPAVGDGDAVGVAREIREHLIRPRERALGVDHPIVAMERLQEGAKYIDVAEIGMIAEEAKRAVDVRGDKALKHQAPKQPRQHAHGQKEIGPAWDPSLTVGCNAAAGDDAMHMRVMGER